MAQLMQAFDANQFDPSQTPGSNLPAGVMKVVVESSELKQNKTQGTGAHVSFVLKVIEGPAAGASGQHNLNIYHSKPDVAKIANTQLSALCHVVGQFNISDTSQLHNIPFFIEVQPQKDNPQYTEVTRVFDLNGCEPRKTAPSMPAPGLAAPVEAAPGTAQGQATTQNQQGWQQPAASQPAANQQQQWQQPAANTAPAGWQQPQAQPQAAAQQQQTQPVTQQQQQWQQQQQPAQGGAPAAWGQR